jgi:hypothetical protein
MLIVAEHLVRRPRVEIRQGRAALADLNDLDGKAAAGSIAPHPQQALFCRSTSCGRDGFSREQGQFAYRFFRRGILDV